MTTLMSDLVWQAQTSEVLRRLVKQVLELSEVVLAMNERLAELEARSPVSSDDNTKGEPPL